MIAGRNDHQGEIAEAAPYRGSLIYEIYKS